MTRPFFTPLCDAHAAFHEAARAVGSEPAAQTLLRDRRAVLQTVAGLYYAANPDLRRVDLTARVEKPEEF